MAKQLINVSRQTVVASHVNIADGYLSRLKGLMGSAGIAPDTGLWIVPCNDIHSCFMRFRFDAIFLNKQLEVLHLVEGMKPWRISRFVKGGHGVLELAEGVIHQTGTQLGDQLAWEEVY